MTDLQKQILELLKEIDALCREHGIEYYLAAGTALGAVRHRGFLPWDDDADIYMTADNWKKFYALRHQLPKDRTLVTVEENFDAGFPINRYVDLTSTRLYRYLCASPQPAGMIVDILVLDPVADDEESIKNYIVSLTDYTSLLCKAAGHVHRCPYKTNFEYYLNRAKEIGRDKVLTELRDKMLACTSEDGGVLIQRDATVPHVWKREVFGKPRYVPFEDIELPIAEDYYRHLCTAFDEDWLNIPDGVGRATHIKGVNLHISNNNPMLDYGKLVDVNEVIALYEKRQELDNLQGSHALTYHWEKLKLTEIKTKIHYEKNWQDPALLLDKLRAGDYEYLSEYFYEYEQVQCHKGLIGSITIGGWIRSKIPYYIDIDDEFLYVFCRYLLHKGLLHKVIRVMKAREDHATLSERCMEIRQLTDTIKQACSLMAYGSYEQAQALAADMKENYPEDKYLHDIWYASRYLLGEEIQELKNQIREDPFQDDVLSAIYADILWKEGDREEALQIYRELLETTHNGLILQSMRERVSGDEALSDRLKIKLGEEEIAEEGFQGEGAEGNSEEESEEASEQGTEEGESDEETQDEGRLRDPRIVSVQQVLLKLLREIDQTCEKHDIQYFLIHRTLLSAVRWHGFEDHSCSLSIAVLASDADRLLQAIQEDMPENRYVESMLNNPNFPHLAIHYGAEDTLDINAANWGDYRCHGISVTVEIIRREETDKLARTYHHLVESVWRLGAHPETTDRKIIRLYQLLDKKINRNREAAARKLYRRLTRTKNRKRGRLFLNPEARSGRDYYSPDVFKEVQYIDFEDIKAPVPAGYAEVLSRVYGSGWMEKMPSGPLNPGNRIISADIPFREFFEKARAEEIDLDKVWEARQTFANERRKFSYINHKVHEVWDKLFFAGERINQWDDYRDKKEQLREAYGRCDVDELTELLEPYMTAASKYSRKGLGLCFDEEVFEYLRYVLAEQGEDELLENIERCIPKQLEVPPVIRTYDGSIVD